jgi:hypothetical protein
MSVHLHNHKGIEEERNSYKREGREMTGCTIGERRSDENP